jgi:hypothetical protein
VFTVYWNEKGFSVYRWGMPNPDWKTLHRKSTTLRPDDYERFRDIGEEPLYEGHDLSRADMKTVWAIGETPEKAIEAFCWARLGYSSVERISPLEGGDSNYQWGRRFTCEGTGFKAAGIYVPGGVILTWWK